MVADIFAQPPPPHHKKASYGPAVYLLVVNGSKIGTKYFASLYVGVCKVDEIGIKGRYFL